MKKNPDIMQISRTLEQVIQLAQANERRFEETAISFQETDRKFQETERLLKESSQETDRKFQETERLLKESSQETDRKFQETERLLKESSQETDRKFQETERLLKQSSQETNKKINKLSGLFGSQWGKMTEALIKPDMIRLFQERKINITRKFQRVESHVEGETMEIDLLLENGEEIVIIEVKTTLSLDDVNELLDDLRTFSKFFPNYADHRIYGAVAGLDVPENVGRYAYKKGLFVISIIGQGITTIKNDFNFKPKDFSQSTA